MNFSLVLLNLALILCALMIPFNIIRYWVGLSSPNGFYEYSFPQIEVICYFFVICMALLSSFIGIKDHNEEEDL